MADQSSSDNLSNPTQRERRFSIPVIISGISGLSFLLSVAYEWTYFTVIGQDLIGFMRVEDYFSSVLKWLPGTVIFMFLGYSMQLVTTRIEGGMTEEEIIASSPAPRFTRFFRNGANHLMRFMVLVGIPLAVLTLPVFFSFLIAIPVFVLWVYTASWLTSHDRVLGWMSPMGKLAFEWVPAFLVMICMFGAAQALMSLLEAEGDHVIVMREDVTLNVVLLRSLEVGLVVRQPSLEKVFVIPWSDVESFHVASPDLSMTPVGCSTFGVFCREDEQPEQALLQ